MIVDLNDPVNIEDYVQTRTPDKPELADILITAKGSRDMKVFASQCGSSAPTFSRIANCKITKPLDPDLLRRIAENASREGVEDDQLSDEAVKNHFLISLLHANGMVDKEFIDRKKSFPFGRFEEDEKQYSRETEAKNIVTLELLNRGYGIKFVERFDEKSGVSKELRASARPTFTLTIQGFEPLYHRFDIHILNDGYKVVRSDRENEVDSKMGRDYKTDAEFLLNHIAIFFLNEVWDPEGYKDVKNTILFDDKKYYDAFKSLMADKKVYTWISLMCVDPNEKRVIDEWFIPRHDGKTMKSLFE